MLSRSVPQKAHPQTSTSEAASDRSRPERECGVGEGQSTDGLHGRAHPERAREVRVALQEPIGYSTAFESYSTAGRCGIASADRDSLKKSFKTRTRLGRCMRGCRRGRARAPYGTCAPQALGVLKGPTHCSPRPRCSENQDVFGKPCLIPRVGCVVLGLNLSP